MREVALTFDNLGDAAEIGRGRPAGGALHPSVGVALPRILALLDELDLRATFCVEGVNAELHPDAVRELAARGHEVAHHSWRHERWGSLPPERERERELFVRAQEALAAAGIEVRGFRPPGGELTPLTLDLLRERGLEWCSPAGERAEVAGGLALLPFRWPLVDAFWLYEPFATQRARAGEPPEPLAPEDYERRFLAELDAAPSPATLVFHPFLAVEERAWQALARLLRRLRALADEGEARVGGAGELARRL